VEGVSPPGHYPLWPSRHVHVPPLKMPCSFPPPPSPPTPPHTPSSTCRHPAIPVLEDYFFDVNGTIELVMELLRGGELFDWVAAKKRLGEDEAKDVFRQIAGEG
jgi:hypothetical protein